MRSTYFQGRPPRAVNMYWRRFAVADIPVDDGKAFEAWLMRRWEEKEALLEYFKQHDHFPVDEPVGPAKGPDGGEGVSADETGGVIETEVKLKHWWEVGQIYGILPVVAALWFLFRRLWRAVVR